MSKGYRFHKDVAEAAYRNLGQRIMVLAMHRNTVGKIGISMYVTGQMDTTPLSTSSSNDFNAALGPPGVQTITKFAPELETILMPRWEEYAQLALGECDLTPPLMRSHGSCFRP